MTTGEANKTVDDRGTTPQQGVEMLQLLCENAFDGDAEKLSVALGRPREEIEAWMNGAELPDDDVVLKARGIAYERGITIE
ncbi:MAG: hypothetical protein NVSMB56_06600 [Pyrinomonadaceae bacterium]